MLPHAVPSGAPFFPVANETQYITWEQDFAGLNNVRLQVHSSLPVMLAACCQSQSCHTTS